MHCHLSFATSSNLSPKYLSLQSSIMMKFLSIGVSSELDSDCQVVFLKADCSVGISTINGILHPQYGDFPALERFPLGSNLVVKILCYGRKINIQRYSPGNMQPSNQLTLCCLGEDKPNEKQILPSALSEKLGWCSSVLLNVFLSCDLLS